MRTAHARRPHGFTLAHGLIALVSAAAFAGFAVAPAGQRSLPGTLSVLQPGAPTARPNGSQTRQFVLAVPEGTRSIVIAADAECQTAWSRLDLNEPTRRAQNSLGLTLRLERFEGTRCTVSVTSPHGTPALDALSFRFFQGDSRQAPDQGI
jgi:hypothetical protein